MSIPTRPYSCVVCGAHDGAVVASGTDYQYATTDQQFDWRECASCGHYYIDPIPTENALGMIYPDTLKNYADFDAKPGLAFRVKSLIDGIQLGALARFVPQGGRMLDVGCAAGMYLDVARKQVPRLEVLEGLEISEAAAARAKQKGYKVYVSTIERADLPTDYYDLISMQQVIEHVHDPRAVLHKIRASLRPGGRVVIETPNLYSWDHCLFRRGLWEGYHIPRHFNLWTERGMEQMLREVGFSAVDVRRRIKPVHWTVSLQNWAIATAKPSWIVRFFNLKNPLALITFGLVDALQLIFFRKASDIQYVATR